MKHKLKYGQHVWCFPVIMIALTVVMPDNPAEAQIVDWINVTNTDSYWHLRANWNTSSVPDATETARFNANRNYEVWWNATTGDRDIGFLSVSNRAVTFLNQSVFSHELTINGSGGGGAFSDFSISGVGTTLVSKGLHLHSLGGAEITDRSALTLDGSHAAGSMLTVSGSTGFDVSGLLNVQSGGIASISTGYIGRQFGSSGVATITGNGSQWNASNLHVGEDGDGILNVEAGGLVSNSLGQIGYSASSTGSVTVAGTGSQWNNSDDLIVGRFGNGTLNVETGGVVRNARGIIGQSIGATSVATVTGPGSQWDNSNNLTLGWSGNGTLNVEAGGLVSNLYGSIAYSPGATGVATVRGPNSQWNNTFSLRVGGGGNGTLNVEAGGVVSNSHGYVGFLPGSAGTAIVTGSESQWNNLGDLYVGTAGSGSLDLANGGTVTVGGTTYLGSLGTVNLSGATSRFEFGETSIGEFSSINATSGSMAGNLNHAGYSDAGSLTALQNSAVDLTDVTLTNSGTLYGSAALGNALVNAASGQVQTVAGERMRFAGKGNTNNGEINNFGGSVLFARDVTNRATGFITGRGVFGAEAGWTNEGVMAFSAGTTDVLGDANIVGAGKVVTSGGATTTFYDDVVHNGSEIRTAAGSQTVFFGSVSGASGFTGLGTVFMEGDLRPGNSPGILAFAGDLVLGSGADTFIELGGYLPGEFDQLQVAHDLALNGDLFVELLDGFQLAFNDEFLIGDVDGLLAGQFNGLFEGDLVGNFGGKNLYITYAAGDGNDVGLFVAVPEPGSFALGTIGLLGCAVFHRRRNRT